jgi:DsbC/DsbD-like thiol-disulfide interchange protein
MSRISRLRASLRVAAISTIVLAGVTTGHAQLRRVKADLTPTVVSTRIQPGSDVRLSLKVVLPEGLHVQSDKPRDPTLIATALTLTPPAGVAPGKVVYPQATDLPLAGQAEPLAVFGHEFTITIDVKLAPDVAPGPLTVPGKLRYQACDDKMCFPPNRVDTAWTLTVESK